MTEDCIWLAAPAKLNLSLRVLGRRDDGYHLLQTWFCLIDRYDRVGLTLRDDGVLRHAALPQAIAPAQDLCLRAAQRLKAHAVAAGGAASASLGVEIRLDKRLPIGGGLGGGSSDAATTLIGLNRLWKLGFSRERLQAIGLELGADVPFFVFGRGALATGVGEQLVACDASPASYLVLVPQVSVSTGEIFSDAALTRDSKPLTIPALLTGQCANDLEPVVVARFPQVAAHLAWLKSQNPAARLTGSGACVFAPFESEAQALAVLARMPKDLQGFVAQGLKQHPLYDWGVDAAATALRGG